MSQSLWCPKCKSENPRNEVKCQCGFVFIPVKPEYFEKPPSPMVNVATYIAGYSLIFVIGGVVSSFLFLRFIVNHDGIGTEPGSGAAFFDLLSIRFLVGGIVFCSIAYGWSKKS